ncbi:hypothetical protein [Halorussus caseinilyticus]|uniref:ArsR family transcriptional regulator n=1 Tax=Halorussus caseinilyticus TaxID=3034025 RepID=A0ABD5WNA7_9EURY
MGTSERDVLRVFETLDDPAEPLATSEVADAAGCTHRVAYDELEALAERGLLDSKRIGARARAWWRPQSATAPDERSDDADETTPKSAGDRTLIERILELPNQYRRGRTLGGNIVRQRPRRRDTRSRTRRDYESDVQSTRVGHLSRRRDAGQHGRTPRDSRVGDGRTGLRFEHWILLPDGTERWLSSNSAPVVNDEGKSSTSSSGSRTRHR